VFALQKELNREEEPTFTQPGLVDKIRLGLGGMLKSKAPQPSETSDRSSFLGL